MGLSFFWEGSKSSCLISMRAGPMRPKACRLAGDVSQRRHEVMQALSFTVSDTFLSWLLCVCVVGVRGVHFFYKAGVKEFLCKFVFFGPTEA